MSQTNVIADTTIDDLLGGRVKLIQPRRGYRVAMDTVLLAAAVPACAGQTVLEPGVGTGGASLCLARRVEGVVVKGIERDKGLLEIANQNVAHNTLEGRITFEEGSITPLEGDGSGYDHVMLNPPFLERGSGIAPKGTTKDTAHMTEGSTLGDWLRYAIHHCKAKGSITIVHRADRLDDVIAGLKGPCGDIVIMPLWPKPGVEARRVIVQARKATKGVARLLPGLTLHTENERYTREAETILRNGDALPMKDFALQGLHE